MSKDYLNIGIIGDKGGIATRRGFRKIGAGNIDTPKYDSTFFESFPTMWASAYAFHRAVEQNASEEKISMEMDEWVVLLSLHYLGVIHLERFEGDTLYNKYDWDLWKALSITYPPENEELTGIELLKIDKLVVGAYYPSIIYFPTRERSHWLEVESLKPYLKRSSLSWENFYRLHLSEDQEMRKQLHIHLRSVAQILDGITLKNALERFCLRHFGEFNDVTKSLPLHPRDWDTYGKRGLQPDVTLNAYPLKKINAETGGTIYYLLTDMPTISSWMNLKIDNGLPAPTAYSKSNATNEILVNFAGNIIKCPISDRDEIKLLKDFFLPHPPAWCKVAEENFVAEVMSFNQVAINSPDRDKNDRAYCLLPIKSDFLKEFSETFREENVRKIKAEPLADEVVRWRLPVLGYEIEFESTPDINANIKKATVSIYPPQVSPKWKIYAAYGGVVENTGNWHLIDEQGRKGNHFIQLKNDEYVSICHDEGETPNRPRALVFIDGRKDENGVLFLRENEFRDFPATRPGSAKLAIDFGTSNTCVAYSLEGGKSEVLKFTLSPKFVWGEPTDIDAPGFVPKKWGGERGFFPTTLFSRSRFPELSQLSSSNIQLENLFQVDLPSLHKGIASPVINGAYEDNYEIHLDLKWGKDSSEPWRSLFLRNVLLYSHAELFFQKQSVPTDYVFTYPLAFDEQALSKYKEASEKSARWIREKCYGSTMNTLRAIYSEPIDESTAIAKSINQAGIEGLLEVFIDIGGGTADIAIRHGDKFVLLDSIRVAGEAFFDFTARNFKKRNLPGANSLRRDLGNLLLGSNMELPLNEFGSRFKDNLGALYSYLISQLDESDFVHRESNILPNETGSLNGNDKDEELSYQKYRSKLFFKHIFLYALIQACALVVSSEGISARQGVRFILGGNGWGLLLFAGWHRSSGFLKHQADQLLQLLKEKLHDVTSEEEFEAISGIEISDVDLLNNKNLNDVKTNVALGALEARKGQSSKLGDTAPFAGIAVRHLKINDYQPETIQWYERWNRSLLSQRLKDSDGRKALFDRIKSVDSATPIHQDKPLDELLSVFISIGNESNLREDNMPGNEWTKMNGTLIENVRNMQLNDQRLTNAPMNDFLTRVLYSLKTYDYLDKLAEVNGVTDR